MALLILQVALFVWREHRLGFCTTRSEAHSVTGRIQGPMGNRDLAMAPHGVFRAEGDDAWIAIAVQSDEQWQRLASLAGIDEPEWANIEGRKRDEDALENRIEEWCAKYGVGTLEMKLVQSGIPAHRLIAIEEFAKDPQIAARGHIVEMQQSLSGIMAIEASPFKLSRTPAQYVRPAPHFGRDNLSVLNDILQLDGIFISSLEEAGALS